MLPSARVCLGALLLPGLGLSSAFAQPADITDSKNHFGLSARFGFNIQAKFKNLPGIPAQTNPGPGTGHAVDRFYDDGYVGVDNAGNNANLTGDWGYQRSSQASASTLSYHSAPPANEAASETQDDPQIGLELTYGRDLGQIGSLTWGLEGGFGYTEISLTDQQTLRDTVMLRTDTYAHTFGAPPWSFAPPGYSGQRNFVSGHPLLSDEPASSITAPVPGTITGWRKVEADLFSLRLGPYVSYPVTQRLAVQAGAGFVAVRTDSTFSFDQTTTTDAGGAVRRVGHTSKDDYLYGGYATALIRYDFYKGLGLFVGAQYHYLENFSQQTLGQEATLELKNSVFLTSGIAYSF